MNLDKDFECLDNLLDEKFLEENILIRRKLNTDTNEEYYEKSLNLSILDDLELSEEELDYTIKCLGTRGIIVIGNTSYYSGMYDNYLQIEEDNDDKSKKVMPKKVIKKDIEQYHKTKDINLRNKIVEDYIPIIDSIADSYSKFSHIDKDILASYGYEGLLVALERYDTEKTKKEIMKSPILGITFKMG